MADLHTWLTVAVIALVTALIRFLPFTVWKGDRKIPGIITSLGTLLPYAIMGMLVVYCLKDVRIGETAGYLPAFMSCAVVAVSYIWKRNTLISIVLGTVCHMLLVQVVF